MKDKADGDPGVGALETGAAEGDAQAQYELGAAYHEGEGVRQDFELAVHWYTRACEHTVLALALGVAVSFLAFWLLPAMAQLPGWAMAGSAIVGVVELSILQKR